MDSKIYSRKGRTRHFMKTLKLTQEQYNELCACGKLHFVNHDVWLITWLTFFKKLAVSVEVKRIDTPDDACEIIELVVE